ncbi:MAG: leucine-rich repeat protein [Bacilli bacterium]|nr:leucine-rich repeat protein [Bacilli bacterium]MDD3305048.1 leucine-rich repeat protein [Bacilli bacterium]MDD4053473.1 leucine-rich repeat protein [Bacilli bacterium]MDD4411757.1 leucine-rich repeat protein [Bacilli bacterium]
MKNKFSKSGFTLIELLGVVVIMLVIIAITIPVVSNIKETVRREAFKATAHSIADSGRLFIANEKESQGYQEFYYRDGLEYNADGRKLDYFGEGPINGIVILNEKNKVVLAIHNGTYCATKSADTNMITIAKIEPGNCNTYSIIETCDTWEQIAIKYDVSLEDLLEANNETDPDSSTCGRNIKIPVESTSSSGTYIAGGDGEEGSTTYSKTYYTVGYISYSSELPLSYEYTIELVVLPLNISDIKTTNVTAKSVIESLEDFKRYIVKKNMGEVIWSDGNQSPLDIEQANTFKDHAVGLSNINIEDIYANCNTETCYVTVNATIDNLSGVNPTTIDGVGQIVYTPIKFTMEFNGEEVCPIAPTAESCFVFDAGTITDYNYTTEGCPSDVSIPSTINGITVKNIGASAFKSNLLTCMTIPNTVTNIGDSAFAYNNLSSITVPETVTSMGKRAFAYNPLIKGVKWNTSIMTVGDYDDGPFVGSDIGLITFGPGVTRITNNLFTYSKPTFTSYTIPDQITEIGYDSLRNMGLTEITIPNTVTVIRDAAFYDNNIGNLTIPTSVITIGTNAFAYNNLSSITIPATVTSMGARAFAYNPLANGVNWNTSITSVGSYNNGPFVGSIIGSITFGPGVTRITNNLFTYSKPTFTSYTIPDQITVIGNDSLRNMGLTEIIIPNTVTSIGDAAFYDNNIVNLIIPSSLTTISTNAFAYNSLEALTIPSNIITIGTKAFANNFLSSITIPATVTSMGSRAFAYNPLVNGVNWNTSITSIGDYNDGPFYGSDVGPITFGENVSRITSFLFAYSKPTSTSYEIPNHITTIGNDSFRNTGLTEVIIPDSVTLIEGYVFKENKLSNLTIPNTVTSIGKEAFYGNLLVTIDIPNSTTYIGTNAFKMTSLTSATIDNTVGSVSFGTTPFGGILPTYSR